MKKLLLLPFSFYWLFSTSCFAQDPELMLNHYQVGLRINTYRTQNYLSFSCGPSGFMGVSILNLTMPGFKTKKFRFTDYVGLGIVPLGYTNSPAPVLPVWVSAEVKYGIQTFYAFSQKAYAGLRIYQWTQGDWDYLRTGIGIEASCRLHNCLYTLAFPSGGNNNNIQLSAAYIFIEANNFKGIGIQLQHLNGKEMPEDPSFKTTAISIYGFMNLASHR